MLELLKPIVFLACVLTAVIHFFKGWNYYNKMLHELNKKHIPFLLIVPFLIFFKGQHNDKGDLYRRKMLKHNALFILFVGLPFLMDYSLDAWEAARL
ncbi:hypothetical protein K6Q96_09060 [Grimontia kaedaensis]|uniref:NnrU domain-containing protein n=1 Tax=Grimontia kaedaensis TaxID=2872157 RepID=A0ABY4WPV3_9GAMM|nr:hypothetical protein [Grimontia kaedaensis]USH01090.1 hypothetical protein K6Q96_09060 [Grimontia kaedaensis]